MKRNVLLFLFCVMLCGGLLSAPSGRLFGEGPEKRPEGQIAIMDMSYIFEHFESFNKSMATMKDDVAAAELLLKTDRDQIIQLEADLEEMGKDAANYKELSEQLLRDKTEFNIKMTKKRDHFLELEADLYWQAFQQAQAAVRQYAKEHGIRAVFKRPIESEERPASREDLLKRINQPIVYEDRLDITEDILTMLNRKDISSAQ